MKVELSEKEIGELLDAGRCCISEFETNSTDFKELKALLKRLESL